MSAPCAGYLVFEDRTDNMILPDFITAVLWIMISHTCFACITPYQKQVTVRIGRQPSLKYCTDVGVYPFWCGLILAYIANSEICWKLGGGTLLKGGIILTSVRYNLNSILTNKKWLFLLIVNLTHNSLTSYFLLFQWLLVSASPLQS